MRILVSILFSLFLMATPSVAQEKAHYDHKDADVKDKPIKELKEELADINPSNLEEAITSFNAAKKSEDSHRLTFYAEHLYLFVEKELSINERAKIAMLWLEYYTLHSDGHKSPEKPYLNTLSLLKRNEDKNHEILSNMYLAIGNFYLKQVEKNYSRMQEVYFNKASKSYNRLIKLTKEYTPKNKAILAAIHIEIGKNYYFAGDGYEALKHLKIGQNIYAAHTEQYPEQLATAEFWIAKVRLARGKYKKAEIAMIKALNILEKTNPNSQLALSGHAFMIQILEKQGRREEATKHAQIIGASRPFRPDQEQIPLYRVPSIYPSNASRRGLGGWVMVEYTIDKHGFVKNSKANHGENLKYFKDAAVAAVEKYRFAPRYEDGKPVSTDNLTIILSYEMKK